MYKLLKPLLFKLDPEKAHNWSTSTFQGIYNLPILRNLVDATLQFEDQRLKKTIWGIEFPNPIGLAAGFDKDGSYIDSFSSLGFGFYEVGTVTPRPQSGNPKPRLFRLPADQAVINRMGFNNHGVDNLVENLKKAKKKDQLIIGGNIGKNKDTPLETAAQDYVISFNKLYPHVDYFVVNVSSPNTPGLRSLQEKEPLTALLSLLIDERKEKDNWKPILLKIAPDLNQAQLDDVISIISDLELDGIIATNTTIDRSSLSTPSSSIKQIGNGGLSGKPLTKRATEVVNYISRATNQRIPIIAVGGIASYDDAREKLDAGASLLQIYTGLIYQGPLLIKRIKKGLVNLA